MGDLDNDMDELFRKAANHYPLKTDGADWDKVMGKLPDAVGTPMPFDEPKKQSSNRKLLWLILLFPMGWLCNSYFNNKNIPSKDITQTQNQNSIKESINSLQNIDNQNSSNSKIDNNNNNKTNTLDNNNEYSTKQKTVTQTITDITKKETADKFFSTIDKKSMVALQSNPNTFTDDDWNKLETEATKGSHSEKNKTNLNNGDVVANGDNLNQNVISIPTSSDSIIQRAAETTSANPKLDKDTLQPKTIDTTKNANNKNIAKKVIAKNKGFYVSALGGLDASSVKSQGVKKVGYGFGLLVGYQLNKHIAFETGLMWDKKQYYTGGEYFNKTRTDIPSNYVISDINGNCNMFELPIDFRYNFAQNKKGLFFATAGFSSYFMKKEAYGYEATAWGATWPAMKTYTNSGSNLFSVINLSAGLEHKISKSISIRISPYLKIPLKGLGIGSIPITSSGVNIGITYPFHK